MMLRHAFRKAAVATLVVAALATTGWWAFVSSASAQSVPPVEAPASAVALDFSTPERTLATYATALQAGDRNAADACCSGTPPAVPSEADTVISFMLAQNRLIVAAARTYHTNGQEARLSPTVDQIIVKVLAFDQATRVSATIDGDNATLPFKLSEDQIAAAPAEIQPQIRAFVDRPIHFVKEAGQWKLVRGGLPVTIVLTDNAGKTLNDSALGIRVVNEYAAIYDHTASGITSGKYASWDQANVALETEKNQLHQKYNLADINFHFAPPAATATAH